MFGIFDENINEKEKNIVIRGNGKRRIELKPIEVEALAFLETQRILTVNQFYQYCTEYLFYDLEEYSFKNRMRRLEEYKVIRSTFHNESSFNSDRFKCISIGSKGIDILCAEGYLDKEYNKKGIYGFLNRKNFVHTIGTQQTIINTFSYVANQSIDHRSIFDIYFQTEEIEENGVTVKRVLSNLKSISPDKYRYVTYSNSKYKPYSTSRNYQNRGMRTIHNSYNSYKNRLIKTSITIVKPDWIIILNSNPEKVLNIEFDVGTEKLNDLVIKMIGYIEIGQRNRDQNHGVIFCLPDETFLSRNKFGDRSKRINNIKELFNNSPNILKGITDANLKIYVVPLKSVGQAAHHFFTGQRI